LIHLGGVEAELVQQRARFPQRLRHAGGVAVPGLTDRVEQHVLQREDERRGFRGGKPLLRAARRKILEHPAGVRPWRGVDVEIAALRCLTQQGQEAAAVL
jgi:hypothetical protein